MGAEARVPVALRRVLALLSQPPAEPDVRRGYLDLLGEDPATATNDGVIQSWWASAIGSALYDAAQRVARRVVGAATTPISWLDLPPGGVALDVGCGPGNLTSALAAAAGPDGLAIGVDISPAMLLRAVRAEASSSVGFVRADAQQLPLRAGVADAVTSLAALQLVPEPARALAEMVRVLRPGGRLAVMVPTLRGGIAERLIGLLPDAGGVHFFADDEIADLVDDLGLVEVRTRQYGPLQWVLGRRPPS